MKNKAINEGDDKEMTEVPRTLRKRTMKITIINTNRNGPCFSCASMDALYLGSWEKLDKLGFDSCHSDASSCYPNFILNSIAVH